jgi:bloom syndrome protein
MATLVDKDDEDSEGDAGRELHANGYEKDNFVVSDHEGEDAFEPVPFHRRRPHQRRQQTLDELGPPISRDTRLDGAGLNEIHQDIVHAFVEKAHEVEENLRNRHGLRRALFTEQQYREMVIRWTTSVAQMYTIRGVDKSKVDLYGARFASIVQQFHAQYLDMMGQAVRLSSAAEIASDKPKKKEVVDLISDDEDDYDMDDHHGFRYAAEDEDDEDEDEENEEDLGPSRYFADGATRTTAPSRANVGASVSTSSVQQWHKRFEELKKAGQAAPSTTSFNGGGAGRGSGASWRGGRKSFHPRNRGGRATSASRGEGTSYSRGSSAGGVSKRRGSVSRQLGRANTSAGHARSKSAAGSKKSAPASGISTMPY